MADETQTQVDEVLPDFEVASSDNSPAPVKKVELDLDDAPFLQADEKQPSPEEDKDNLPPVDDAADAAKKRKKRLILIGIAAGLLIIIFLAVWWFFFRTPPPPPPEAPKPDVIVVPSTPANAEPGDIVREFAPFVVPVQDSQGKTNFLVCKFSAITQDPKVNQEMQQRIVPLRDAIYFYLRGKNSDFLLDARNGADIKKDLISVFNDYLSQGKLEDIVFESYLSN